MFVASMWSLARPVKAALSLLLAVLEHCATKAKSLDGCWINVWTREFAVGHWFHIIGALGLEAVNETCDDILINLMYCMLS